jgi:2-keto-4-pentenoate hydratase
VPEGVGDEIKFDVTLAPVAASTAGGNTAHVIAQRVSRRVVVAAIEWPDELSILGDTHGSGAVDQVDGWPAPSAYPEAQLIDAWRA